VDDHGSFAYSGVSPQDLQRWRASGIDYSISVG
jgi:hypothetical protein